MKRLILPWILLQSASICSAKNDPRKYLNGVTLIDGHVVATDAERVFYCKYDELPKLKKPLTIPLKAIKNLEKKLDKTRSDCLVEGVRMLPAGPNDPIYVQAFKDVYGLVMPMSQDYFFELIDLIAKCKAIDSLEWESKCGSGEEIKS